MMNVSWEKNLEEKRNTDYRQRENCFRILIDPLCRIKEASEKRGDIYDHLSSFSSSLIDRSKWTSICLIAHKSETLDYEQYTYDVGQCGYVYIALHAFINGIDNCVKRIKRKRRIERKRYRRARRSLSSIMFRFEMKWREREIIVYGRRSLILIEKRWHAMRWLNKHNGRCSQRTNGKLFVRFSDKNPSR